MKRVIKPVPGPAKFLLDFLSGPESRGDYEVWSSFKQRNLPKPLTESTISEVLEYQRNWRSVGGISSAAGRYQIIRKTLLMLVQMLGLTGDELFDEGMQDRLGYQLLKIRGYDAWLAHEISDTAFANKLAREWASLPVVTRQKNYKGAWINPGSSYYAGDGLNSHGTSADQFMNAIEQAKIAGDPDDAFVPVPKPSKTSTATKIGAGVAAGGAGVAATDGDLGTVLSVVNTVKPMIMSFGAWAVLGVGVAVGGYFLVRYLRNR